MDGAGQAAVTGGAQGTGAGVGAGRPPSSSKSRALRETGPTAPVHAAGALLPPCRTGGASKPTRWRCFSVAQGMPEVRHASMTRRRAWALLGGLLLAVAVGAPVAAAGAAGCGEPLPLVPLQAGVWLLPGQHAADGDADPANRGQVANLLLAADGDRLWLVGSGPSPAFGRRLACELQRQLGRGPTDAIAPWAHPELVLGQSGFGAAVRLHAHRAVATAMGANCPSCVERLRVQLGAAAADLDGAAVRLPQQLLEGDRGRLGPFDWQALDRGDGQVVTLWQLRGTPWRTAHGLLWGDGPPDGRGADLRRLMAATVELAALAAADPALRWVPEQGPVQPAAAAVAHARYWQGLLADADDDVAAGRTEGPPPPARAGPTEWSRHPRHALNWQRAWRQSLDRSLAPPPR